MRRAPHGALPRALVILLTLAGGLPLGGLEPARAITQYLRESWTARDGAPSGIITGIAQTPNGYLWLGTEGEGLVRFDGAAFVRTEGLDALFGRRVERITSLLSGRDGALWVGTSSGLARFRDGAWTAFDRGAAKDVYGLHESADGAVRYGRHWEGVYRVVGEVVTHLPLTGKPRFVTSDTAGTVWAGGYEGLWRLAGEDRRLYTTHDGLPDQNVNCVYADGDGNVWLGFQTGLALLRDDKIVATFTTRDGLSDNDISAIYTDRDGILWVGTVSGGLNRRRAGRFESLTKALGLTSNHVTSIGADHEGSLWVGTTGGLNRLRDASLLPLGETEGLSPKDALSIAEGRDGEALVASGFGGLNRIRDGHVQISPAESVPGARFDGPLWVDPDGGIWSGHRDGLSYRRDGRGTHYVVPGQVTSITRDAHSIVYSVGTGEIFRLLNGKPERYRLANGSLLGPETVLESSSGASNGFDYVWMVYVSHDGTLWLATSRGAFAVHEGQARLVWRHGTLSARSISEDEQGTLWLGTMAGIVRVKNGTLATFTAREGLVEDDVHRVLSDRRGSLWLAGVGGIFRVEQQALDDVADGKAKTFTTERFGIAEGMRATVAAGIYQPSACIMRDGRLWFTTSDGVVIVDPTHLRRNSLPPPVVIEALVADGESVTLGPSPHVPPGTAQVAISYNGLSLVVPRRVRFKYRLEGYDKSWVEAQGRRVAYYTKLPPGRYRFQVIAANNDGLWNEVGATLDLVQLPHLYQTSWFLAFCALALLGMLVAAYNYRERRHQRVEQELELRVQEALARIKILSGMLPICAWCKRVRDDSGYWSQIESYVAAHSDAEFTHGICPDCQSKV